MKKMKTGIGVMLALLCCILMCTGVVYATGDDTDGTELQVAQPVILEVQLGPQWAGVEFQLKTDAGLYPGTIAVGQDGILRTELGNSGSYVLSCLTLNAAVPAPGDIPSPDVTQQEQEPLTTDSAENADAASQNVQEQDSGRPTVSGIPVMHIILFGGGLLLAVGDAALGEVVGGHFHSDLVAFQDTDVILAHFAGNVAEHGGAVLQLDAEQRVGQ